jgi:hypothetical protein
MCKIVILILWLEYLAVAPNWGGDWASECFVVLLDQRDLQGRMPLSLALLDAKLV